MHPHTLLPLSAPDSSNLQTNIVTTPAELEELPSPVNTGLNDDGDGDDLTLRPHEKHIQLTLAASQAGFVSQGKAALYYGVPHSTTYEAAGK
ncbi:hypothetical protein B0H19DRAFT_1277795 [Mycena capillaripes]|nr:hypothetical protein B0H19DRAFT_1277795 [Mycena capillaripes]